MDRRSFLKMCSATLLGSAGLACEQGGTGGTGVPLPPVGPGPSLPGSLPVSSEP